MGRGLSSFVFYSLVCFFLLSSFLTVEAFIPPNQPTSGEKKASSTATAASGTNASKGNRNVSGHSKRSEKIENMLSYRASLKDDSDSNSGGGEADLGDNGDYIAPRIIIAGAPASGKGTQCEILKEELGVIHLSTGDILRQAVKDGSPLGLLAKSYMDEGKLVPDDVIIGVVKSRLDEDDCQQCGWLLDGFPRTLVQAEALSDSGIVPDVFLLLEVPDELLVERVIGRRSDPETGKIYHLKYNPPPQDDPELLKRLVHRADDTEEKIVVRVQQFHENCNAVSGCYEDILVKVDGTQKKEKVYDDIMSSIKDKVGLQSLKKKKASSASTEGNSSKQNA